MKSKFTKFKHLSLAMAFLLIAGMTFAQSTTMTKSFTSNDTWTVPANVSEITIECIGGGGAGGHVQGKGFRFQCAGGGGGGAYAKSVVTVTAGQNVTVVVGNGAHAWSTEPNQPDGGDSYVEVEGTLVVKAAGGKTVKGENNTNGAAGGAVGACVYNDVAYAGGNGGNGYHATPNIDKPGGGGGAAGSTGNGNNGGQMTGGAAKANYGGKGADAIKQGIDNILNVDGVGKGNTGGNYGGGGSGSKCTGWNGQDGGEGAKGYVIITYTADPELIVNDMTATICSGETFTVIPTGTIPAGTTYAWSAPSVTGITGTAAGSGATEVSGTLTSTNTTNTDVVYNVTATNGGSHDDFTVTVTVKGIITPGTIEANITSCNAGDTAKTFTSTTGGAATGTGTYQWEKSTDGSTWELIENATSENYTPIYLNNLGLTYYKRKYQSDCETVESNILTLQYPGTIEPGNVKSSDPTEYCYASEVKAVLDTSLVQIQGGTNVLVQWQESTDGGVTWNNISGATSHIYNVNITSITTPISYRYTIKIAAECDSVPSNNQWDFTTYPEPTPSFISATISEDFVSSLCKYGIPDLQDTLEKCFKSSCTIIKDYDQTPAKGTIMDLNSTETVTANITTVYGTTYTVSVVVTSPNAGPVITTADIEFDDKNDTITLYYGVCDTLYYVNTPNYDVTSSSPYAKSDLTLTNDAPYGGTVNEGTILGRISGGEHTIIWTIESPCGNTLNYPKKYIVMYPPCGDGETVTDADGITYQTVRIGCECWTKPNLKTKTGVKDTSYVYQNDPANEEKFGRLYTWYSAVGITKDGTAADIDTTTDPKSGLKYIQGICPTGWAIPTSAAYSNMVATAGGVNNIKSSDATTWLDGFAGTDAAGFTAVGAGYHVDHDYYFYDLLGETYFWTCEGDPITKKGTCCSITHICPELLIKTVETGMANSIRCVRRVND